MLDEVPPSGDLIQDPKAERSEKGDLETSIEIIPDEKYTMFCLYRLSCKEVSGKEEEI